MCCVGHPSDRLVTELPWRQHFGLSKPDFRESRADGLSWVHPGLEGICEQAQGHKPVVPELTRLYRVSTVTAIDGLTLWMWHRTTGKMLLQLSLYLPNVQLLDQPWRSVLLYFLSVGVQSLKHPNSWAGASPTQCQVRLKCQSKAAPTPGPVGPCRSENAPLPCPSPPHPYITNVNTWVDTIFARSNSVINTVVFMWLQQHVNTGTIKSSRRVA